VNRPGGPEQAEIPASQNREHWDTGIPKQTNLTPDDYEAVAIDLLLIIGTSLKLRFPPAGGP